ncbi:MAG TPA: beta-glucosidase [Clostridiaceae bacterium]|nr:beta-glucosidase [Clostridiaceae bacterium]
MKGVRAHMTDNKPLYKDPSVPVEDRVEDLLSRMTLDEKIAQLVSRWHYEFFNEKEFDKKVSELLRDGLGTISWLLPPLDPEENVKVMNRIQKYAVEETRLGIPVIFHGEALAGGLFYGATYFPTAIGLASTWEPELISEMCSLVREQMYEYGVRIVFSPVLDIARDPRWGRIGETYGEDPYLASQMGMAFVKAMQGSDLTKGIACTGKHFLGYAAGEGGRNRNVASIGKRELYEIYARPFEAVIKNSKVKAIMNSYGVIDNVPVAASREILTGLLRKKLGFDGIVVSDYGAVAQLYAFNRSAKNLEDAAVQAITAGIDIEQPDPVAYPCLKDAIAKGIISEEVINSSVRRMLKLKFELGLFEQPYAPGDVKRAINRRECRELAYKLAVKSLVLLKNEDNILPLDKDIDEIAVVGPNAGHIRCFFGGYSPVAMREITPEALNSVEAKGNAQKAHCNEIDAFARQYYKNSISVLEAISEIVSKNTRINYAKGCELTGNAVDGFGEAIEAVRRSRVAIAVMGGIEGLGATTTCGEGRDSVDITLPGVQRKLLEELYNTGKPIILVIMSSRPLEISWEASKFPAVLQAWSPGEEGGRAVAGVLFGDEVPGGKLPVTTLRNVGQIPLYYNRKPIYGNIDTYAEYIDGNNEPLFPFGHGLSYTEFQYSDLVFEEDKVDSNGSVSLSFSLKNVGRTAGEEVVQVYFRDMEANVARPVKELVAFKRVALEPGEHVKLKFEISLSQLAFYDKDMNFVVEPGGVEVFIGSSSQDIRLNGRFEITGNRVYLEERKVFASRCTCFRKA